MEVECEEGDKNVAKTTIGNAKNCFNTLAHAHTLAEI